MEPVWNKIEQIALDEVIERVIQAITSFHLIDYELSIIGFYFNTNGYDLRQTCIKVIKNESLENSKFINFSFIPHELACHVLNFISAESVQHF